VLYLNYFPSADIGISKVRRLLKALVRTISCMLRKESIEFSLPEFFLLMLRKNAEVYLGLEVER